MQLLVRNSEHLHGTGESQDQPIFSYRQLAQNLWVFVAKECHHGDFKTRKYRTYERQACGFKPG
jgi:hypothetical protein